MLHWKELTGLSDEQLAALDIALVNLACALDLPGAEGIDQDACAFKLDYWSRRVRQYTEAALPKFRRKRWDYRNSEGYFRALCMITVLQRDLGVRYNPDKIPEEAPLEVADTFVHGAILGEGGTCASLPVVYAAVGRRLGYPLKLAVTKVKDKPWGHLFVRWDDAAGERFNIEATNRGLTSEPDDYYRTGIYEITPEQEEKGQLLRSLTPRQELAGFLAERGHRWLDTANRRRATESFSWAFALHPENRMIWNRLCRTMNEWNDALERRKPRVGHLVNADASFSGEPALPRREERSLPRSGREHAQRPGTGREILGADAPAVAALPAPGGGAHTMARGRMHHPF